MNAIQALGYIKETLGTGRKCAAYLGYTEGYINSFLCARKEIPEKAAALIIFKAEQLKREMEQTGMGGGNG